MQDGRWAKERDEWRKFLFENEFSNDIDGFSDDIQCQTRTQPAASPQYDTLHTII